MDGLTAPRWSLESIYPGGFEGSAFRKDADLLVTAIASARTTVADGAARQRDPAEWLRTVLSEIGRAGDLYETLESFCYSRYSVDTADEAAIAGLNRISETGVPLASLAVEFRDALAALDPPLGTLLETHADLADYRFILEEELFFQRRQLTAPEESLAADLARSGADAWSRLQETISSELTAPWGDEGETKTVVELRNLAHDPDRDVRRRAWEAELAAWKRMETPLAFAINGVKGATHVLNSRRGWESTLERSARQNRLSQRALDALVATMSESLPLFRRYLRIKARALGVPRLAFYDIFAPVGESGAGTATWSFSEAVDFITDRVREFDPEQATFVSEAVKQEWIDAEPRPGKVGGAYCIDFPRAGESRILANFDGTYDGMSTIAHELGHAWHSAQLRDLPPIQRQYPMTLAETASIFTETLVFFGTRAIAEESEELAITEQFLQGSTQVIVDILSRFIFEKALMERRATREVSAKDLCEMILAAQGETYGDALDPTALHPYMWAVKGHYYRAELAFYNFPYAFGQLFGLGLYRAYQDEPEGFAGRYRTLLRETGRSDAVSVAAAAGFDIESPEFWRSAIAQIGELVDRFEELVAALYKGPSN
jgi:pepF/M3 family oligoendopeptidase